MRWRRFSFRPTILAAMIVIALVAVGLGVVRHRMDVEARARLVKLKGDFARAKDRLAWFEEMSRGGCYTSPVQVQALLRKERAALDQVKLEIQQFGGR